MLRVLLLLILVPAITLIVWLAFGTPPERGEFVMTSKEPRTVDPQRVSWLPEIQIADALFEGLTRLNPTTYQPEPAVAASWEESADHLVWTFHLRLQARWSNGAPVRAEDFRFAWQRVLDPHVAAQYASLLFVIRGAEPYYRSREDDDPANDRPADELGVEAVDPQTLRVTLAAPCAYFLDLTSFPTLAPLYRPVIEQWAYRDGHVLGGTQHLWTRPGNIVCNGPFLLTCWTFKKRILLERNPYYWEADAIHLASIEVYITSDPNAALMAYEAGRVDLVRGVEASVARVLLAEQQAGRRRDFHLGDRFATSFYRVNCTRPPLDDADFRKALALAVDREALCAHVLGLGEIPAHTYIPPGAVHLMPRRAPDPEQRRIAEAVQQMWSEVLGLHVELRTLEGTVLSTRIRDLDYDLALSDWFGDYLDPSTFLTMFTTGDGQNRTGWSNGEYDGLIAAAAREPDNEHRFAELADAERILCEDGVPIITLFHRRGNFLLNPRFEGLTDHVLDRLPVHRIRRSDGS
jgi:oligopeptide transport system substrate-binding protein